MKGFEVRDMLSMKGEGFISLIKFL